MFSQYKMFIFWNIITKNHGQVSFDKKYHQGAIIAPAIASATHTG